MISAPIDFSTPEAEAYRTLRTNVSSLRMPGEQRSMLVTSARPGEGKSTTAANFAVACAYSERPTLLIDADMRNPAQHEAFARRNDYGLSSLLGRTGADSIREVAEPTSIPHLDLVVAGPYVPNPAELLGRPAMTEMIAEAKEHYDWIIFDSPPVLPVTDAAVLAGVVDGCVLVVDFRRTKMRHARKAKELLRSVQAPLLGVVVNQAKALDVSGGAAGYYAPRPVR